MPENKVKSPFLPAKKQDKKTKVLIYGDSGTGKTVTSLFVGSKYGKIALFDLDGGADLYGNRYNFSVLKSTNLKEIKEGISYIVQNPKEFQTIIIDPLTIYWDLVQRYWSDVFIERNKGHKANKYEFYDFGPKEWAVIKTSYKNIFNDIIPLDMHIICTARETVKMKRMGNEYVSDGVKYDAEKNTHYSFDTVVKLYKNQEKHMAYSDKDRTSKMPNVPFEMNKKNILKYFIDNSREEGGKDSEEKIGKQITKMKTNTATNITTNTTTVKKIKK